MKSKLSKRSDRRDPINDSARTQSNLSHALKLKGGFDKKLLRQNLRVVTKYDCVIIHYTKFSLGLFS